VPPNLLENYARFVRKLFGDRAKSLGWAAQPGEKQETRLLRPALVPFVARYEPALAAEARRLADGWLADRKGVDADMLGAVLRSAAFDGDRRLFDALLAALKSTPDLRQREHILGALGSFRDPKLISAALDLSIHSDLDVRESIRLAFAGSRLPETQKIPFEFIKSNYEEIVKRAPAGGGSDFGAALPSVASGFCDADSEKEFVDFFQERAKKAMGGPRNYTQVLEGIRLCEARKSAEEADVAAFFARQ
jgi:alanyl aminopeptidase